LSQQRLTWSAPQFQSPWKASHTMTSRTRSCRYFHTNKRSPSQPESTRNNSCSSSPVQNQNQLHNTTSTSLSDILILAFLTSHLLHTRFLDSVCSRNLSLYDAPIFKLYRRSSWLPICCITRSVCSSHAASVFSVIAMSLIRVIEYVGNFAVSTAL